MGTAQPCLLVFYVFDLFLFVYRELSALRHSLACLTCCLAGDTVGALLNRTTKTISYIKNGLDLGIAFHNVDEEVLFPSVGLRTPDEEVCVLLS